VAALANIYKGSTSNASATGISIGATVVTANSFILASVKFESDTSATDNWCPVTPVFTSTSTFDIKMRSYSQNLSIQWVVYEYTSGVTAYHVTGTYPTGATKTISIGATIDQGKSFILGGPKYGAGYFNASKFTYTYFASNTQIGVTTGGDTSGGQTYYYTVVEYDDAVVQSGTFTLTGTSETQTLSPAVDEDTTLIITSQIASSWNEIGQWDLSSSTLLRSRRGSTTSRAGHYFAIEFPDFTVTRGYDNLSSSQTTKTIAVSPAMSDTTKAFAMISPNFAGNGTGECSGSTVRRAFVEMAINSTSQISATRDVTDSEQNDFVWTVFEYTGAASAKAKDFAPFFPAG